MESVKCSGRWLPNLPGYLRGEEAVSQLPCQVLHLRGFSKKSWQERHRPLWHRWVRRSPPHLLQGGSFKSFSSRCWLCKDCTYLDHLQCNAGDCVEISEMKCNRTCDGTRFPVNRVDYILLQVLCFGNHLKTPNLWMDFIEKAISQGEKVVLAKCQKALIGGTNLLPTSALGRPRWAHVWHWIDDPYISYIIHYNLQDQGDVSSFDMNLICSRLLPAWTNWWQPAQTSGWTRRWAPLRWTLVNEEQF